VVTDGMQGMAVASCRRRALAGGDTVDFDQRFRTPFFALQQRARHVPVVHIGNLSQPTCFMNKRTNARRLSSKR
jgi:hypothetical protein